MLTLPRQLPEVGVYVAGLRPFREGGVRLEAERWGDRWMVHNYGHGGAGITLAPGSARLAARELQRRLSPPARVAVLGSGIIGLTTAAELAALGYAVTVYARDFPPHTTSDVAGGLWGPVEVGQDGPFAEMLDLSYSAYQNAPGVLRHPVWFDGESIARLEYVPPQLKLVPGERFIFMESLLILIAEYLRSLPCHPARVERTFVSRDDVLSLPDEAFVNCLGPGAGPLVGDPLAQPIRGQLVRMRALEEQFTVIHANGYLISRPDMLLAGGTFEHGVDDLRPDDAACRAIVERNQAWLDELHRDGGGRFSKQDPVIRHP